MHGRPWSWVASPEEDFGAFGWDAEVVVQPGEKGADYGRWEGERPPPRRVGVGRDPSTHSFVRV